MSKQYKTVWPTKVWVSEDKVLAMAKTFWTENEGLKVNGLKIGGTWNEMSPEESLHLLEWFKVVEYKKRTETLFVTRTLP